MSLETAKALSEVDAFYKDCLLMFYEIEAIALAADSGHQLTKIFSDFLVAVWDVDNSGAHASHFFKAGATVYFASMIIKARDDLMPDNNEYRSVSDKLGVDSRFPLLLAVGSVSGVLDESLFNTRPRLARWPGTLLYPSPGNSGDQAPVSERFGLNTLITVPIDGATATFTLHHLLEIRTSEDLQKIVATWLEPIGITPSQ